MIYGNGESSEGESRMETLHDNKSGYVCKINKYVCLGSGSFGSVYPGYFKSSAGHKIDVAVKIVSLKVSDYQLFEKTLEREKKTHKELFNAKHIVRLYSCIRESSEVYLIMEKCDEDLSVFFSQREFNEKEVRFYFRQILVGYQELFAKSITHNDIKPENILVKDKSVLKLGDFGLTQTPSDDNQSFARNNRSWNTTPPEMRFQYGSITSQSDIWSLGIVLYWMIYKKYPYLQKSCFESYKTKPLFPGISDNLKDVLSNLLEFQAEKRWTFPKLFSNSLFSQQHFVSSQLNSPEYLFDEPIFIDISQLESCLDKKPSIEFYFTNDEFNIDQLQTTMKRQIQDSLSVLRLKISFLKLFIKKIQCYSIYSISEQSKKRPILFLKKLLLQTLQHYIHALNQQIADFNFLSPTTFVDAKRNQQTDRYLKYISAIYKHQVKRWEKSMIEENSLLSNYHQLMESQKWVLKRNWNKTKPYLLSHLSTVLQKLIGSFKQVKLDKEEYTFLHYLLLLRNHSALFDELRDKGKQQKLYKFISDVGDSESNINNTYIQAAMSLL